MRSALLVALMIATFPAAAAIYKIVNPDGTFTFSDRPQAGSVEVDVGPVQTYQAPALPQEQTATPGTGFAGYDVFEVSSPKEGQTFRDNGGFIKIQLSLKPGLFREHSINIFMDGKDLGGNGRTTVVTLQNVDRGSHNVHATVVDKDGKQVLRTSGVTFHLHRSSVP